ncbi:MAG: helix-turn-helix domain-containing protein [Chloroflexales bacterium]
MLSPTEWLARVGFSEGNPFALKWAEDERDRLHEYFVEHHAYHAMIDADMPRSILLHAPRGAGKSSTRRMFTAYCQAHEARLHVMLLQLTDWMPIVERVGTTKIGPRDLLAEVLRLFMVALAELPIDPGVPLAPDEASYLRWIGATYGDYLRPSQRATCIARGWLAAPDEPQADLAHASLASLPVLRCFELITQIATALGRPRCYLIIDGVDELCTTSADWTAGADLLIPLLGNLRLLEVPGFAIKCFVPTEIVKVLRERGQLREDRLVTVELRWSVTLLRELLRSRLMVFSESKIESLAMIAVADLADIDQQLCRAAVGSPRRLLNLGDNVVRACARDATDDDLLVHQTHVWAAIADEAPAPEVPTVSAAPPQDVPRLRLDPDGSVWRGDVQLPEGHRLTNLQRRLLTYLYEHPNKLCSTEELIRYVWAGRNEPSDKDSLRRLADRLVELIEPNPHEALYLERLYGGFFVLRHTAE